MPGCSPTRRPTRAAVAAGPLVAGPRPGQGAHHAAAIERVGRDQVEQRRARGRASRRRAPRGATPCAEPARRCVSRDDRRPRDSRPRSRWLTSGPATATATSSRGRGTSRASGEATRAEEVDDDRIGRHAPRRRATIACASSWAIADARNPIATATPIAPSDRPSASRDPRRPTWVATVTTMSARMIAHETWIRISRPATRPSGNALIPVAATGAAASASVAVRPCRTLAPRATTATIAAMTAMITMPDDDRRLVPELRTGRAGRALSVGGSNVVGPGREEELVEDLEERVEGDERDDHRARPRRPRARVAPRRTRTATAGRDRRIAPAGDREHDRRERPPRRHSATKTSRTSRMWARSRSSRTGRPATATSKSGGPMTRSARIASVASRRSAVE